MDLSCTYRKVFSSERFLVHIIIQELEIDPNERLHMIKNNIINWHTINSSMSSKEIDEGVFPVHPFFAFNTLF